jgi:hypothetical protein
MCERENEKKGWQRREGERIKTYNERERERNGEREFERTRGGMM